MTKEDDLPVIDPAGAQLVYVVIADHITAKIRRGDLLPGQRLPGELSLAETYGVARMTVSRAVRELRERGLIVTVVGKGSFVVDPLPSPEH
ncbi:GntR family transcriptional regulator [Streptomyces sp. NPDC001221]